MLLAGWAAYLRWLKKKRGPRAPPPSVCNYIRTKASIWHPGVPVLNYSMCKHRRAQLGSTSAATKCFICPQVSLIYVPLNTRVGSGILRWLQIWVDKSVNCGALSLLAASLPTDKGGFVKSDGYIRKSRFPKKRVSNPPRSIQTKALLGQRGILFFVFFFQITNGSGRQLMKKVDLLADQLQVYKKKYFEK